jgi:hypothetical protein
VIVLHVPTRDSSNKYQFQDAVINAIHSLCGSDAVALGDTNTGEPRLDEEAKFFNAKEAASFDQMRAAGLLSRSVP